MRQNLGPGIRQLQREAAKLVGGLADKGITMTVTAGPSPPASTVPADHNSATAEYGPELPLQQPPGPSRNKAGGMNVGRLPEFIKRVEKLEEERTELVGDIRDVYSEAKGAGYDVKTIRKLIQLRKMDEADRAEQETLLDVYKHALGMV